MHQSIKIRAALALDTLLDFVWALMPILPGNRNDPKSLESRVAKAVEKNTARMIAQAEQLDAVISRAEDKAVRIVDSIIRTTATMHSQLEQLRKSGLVPDDERMTKATMGLMVAHGHPDLEVIVER